MRPLFLTFLLGSASLLCAQSRNLDIYWIDVEGGAATLVVSPSGESMLIDTGYTDGDRDAKRIYAATQLAGLKKIDYVVISHFHADHAGGLPALSKMIPMGQFFSRSDEELEKQNERWRDSFNAAAGGKRTIVKPGGDIIPFKGVETVVVTSDAKVLTKPVKGGGAANPLCTDAEQKSPAGPENQRMVGLMLTFGKFKLLNLADLDWEREMALVCPVNPVGAITLYHSSRHGGLDDSGAPAFLGAIRPQVVVLNNGPRKGLGQNVTVKSTTPGGMRPYEKNSYLRLAKTPGVEDIWQGHLSLLDSDPSHNTSQNQIANLEDTPNCAGNWIKASVAPDGKFTITNGRNGFSKTYTAR